jgi:hypothetical protein
MFRARLWVGRDAWFALGAFFAPAPWRGGWSNALNVSGAALGGGAAWFALGAFFAAAPWRGGL